MPEELEGSLIDVIGSAGGKDLLEEAAEFALDSLVTSDSLKDIPVIGTVAKLYSIAVDVQGYIFAKKIRRFLIELASVPHEERKKFIGRINSDHKYREKTVDTLTVIIDRLDDLEKAPLLARALAGHIKEEYDFTTFRRLASAIDRCLVSDLWLLEKLDRPKALEGYVGDILMSAGLASLSAIPVIKYPDTKSTYELSQLGQLFRQVVFRGLERDDDA